MRIKLRCGVNLSRVPNGLAIVKFFMFFFCHRIYQKLRNEAFRARRNKIYDVIVNEDRQRTILFLLI